MVPTTRPPVRVPIDAPSFHHPRFVRALARGLLRVVLPAIAAAPAAVAASAIPALATGPTVSAIAPPLAIDSQEPPPADSADPFPFSSPDVVSHDSQDPAALGACCLPDGSCIAPIDPSTCHEATGFFRGEGTSCDPSSCPDSYPQEYAWLLDMYSGADTLLLRIYGDPGAVAAAVGEAAFQVLAERNDVVVGRAGLEAALGLARASLSVYRIVGDESGLPSPAAMPVLYQSDFYAKVPSPYCGFAVGASGDAGENAWGSTEGFPGVCSSGEWCASPSGPYRTTLLADKLGAGVNVRSVESFVIWVDFWVPDPNWGTVTLPLGFEEPTGLWHCGVSILDDTAYPGSGGYSIPVSVSAACLEEAAEEYTDDGEVDDVFLRAVYWGNSYIELERVRFEGTMEYPPDLAVDLDVVVDQDDESPYEGTVTVTIENRGGSTSNPVLLAVENERDETTLYEIPEVEPWVPYEIHHPVAWLGSGGFLTLDLDVYGWEYEAHENNNRVYQAHLAWPFTPPRRPIVIVPGILGSTLEKNGQMAWPSDILGMGIALGNPGNLRLDDDENEDSGHPDAEPVDILRSVSKASAQVEHLLYLLHAGVPFPFGQALLTPLLLDDDIWGETLADLDDAGYREGTDLFVAPYDWRKSMQTSAGNLRQAITDARNTTGVDEVVVVCHSMGGLLPLEYIRQQQLNNEPHHIWAWVTLGTPFQGSPKAFMGLAGVSGMMPGSLALDVLGMDRKEQDLNRTLPSVYTLTPTDEYEPFVYAGGEQGSAAYPAHGHLEYFWRIDTPVTMAQIRRSLDPVDPEPLPVGISLPSNFAWDPAPAERARTFWAFVPGDVAVPHANHLVGSDRKTWSALVAWKETGVRYEDGAGQEVEYDAENLTPLRGLVGDGTVPLQSALGAQRWGGDYYFWEKTEHVDLPANPEASAVIEQIALAGDLVGESFANLQATPYQPALDHVIYVEWRTSYPQGSPPLAGSGEFPIVLELLEITDFLQDETTLLAGNVELTEGGRSEYGYVSLSERVRLLQSGRQAILAIDVPEDGVERKYRVVVSPSAATWDPTEPVVGGGFDRVLGHMAVYDRNSIYLGPADRYDDPVRFESLGDMGFAAQLDMTVIDGDIQESMLEIYVDVDGDGLPDSEATVGIGDGPSTVARPTFPVTPNPSSGAFHLAFPASLGDLTNAAVEVFDATGRLVAEEPLEGRREMSVSGLDVGVYWLRLRGGEGTTLGLRKVTVVR